MKKFFLGIFIILILNPCLGNEACSSGYSAHEPSSKASKQISEDSLFKTVGTELMNVVRDFPNCKEAVKCFVDDSEYILGNATPKSVAIHIYAYSSLYEDDKKKKNCRTFDDKYENPLVLFGPSSSAYFYRGDRDKVLRLCRQQKVEIVKDKQKLPRGIPNPNWKKSSYPDIEG